TAVSRRRISTICLPDPLPICEELLEARGSLPVDPPHLVARDVFADAPEVGPRADPPGGDLPEPRPGSGRSPPGGSARGPTSGARSEEHTSELQSLAYIVCRLL